MVRLKDLLLIGFVNKVCNSLIVSVISLIYAQLIRRIDELVEDKEKVFALLKFFP